MGKVTLVTEGHFDSQLLHVLLPREIQKDVNFLSGSGINSAISIAKSLILGKNNNVILFLDSLDSNRINEDFNYLMNNLKSYETEGNLKIIIIHPPLEDIILKILNKKMKKEDMKKIYIKTQMDLFADFNNDTKNKLLKDKKIINLMKSIMEFKEKSKGHPLKE